MARCPRCNSRLSLEYDDEGHACDGWCDICEWPTEYVECPGCDEEMLENRVQELAVINGEEECVCEGCAERIAEELEEE